MVFDLDGTLIDSLADIHAASNRVLAAEGFAALTAAEVRGFIGKGVPHLIARLLGAVGEDPQGPRHARMLAAFTAGYADAVGLTRAYPGVEAALETLAAAGHPLGVCTNKPEGPARAVLAHLDLLRHFGSVVGGDRLAARKPDLAVLAACVAELGGGRPVYVGDSEVDAETARRAGAPFLLYTEGYRSAPVASLPAVAAFSDWSDLPTLVARAAGLHP